MKLYRTFVVWVALLVGLTFLLAGCAEAPTRNIAPTAGPSARPGAPQRLALVIGNGKYKDSPLINPPNDARAMASALSDIGFQVIKLEDASLKQMSAAVRDFGDRLRKGGGVGLFFYAGHGIQIRGKNFLVPVDAEIQREDEVQYASFDANEILDKMEAAGNGTNIMILDACRNNPFARSFRSAATGLAQMDAPVGSYISFATAPGRVASDGSGANGLYTQHLIENIRHPGLKIEDVFKKARVAVMNDSAGQQIPWDNSSLTGDFYFVPPSATASAPAVTASEPPSKPAPATPESSGKTASTAPSPSPAPANGKAGTSSSTAQQAARTESAGTAPAKPETAPRKEAVKPPTQVASAPRETKPAESKAPPTKVALATPPGPSTMQKPGAAGEDLYRNGKEAQKKGTIAVAADMFQQAADMGHPGAQYELALLYKVGRRPLPQDLPKARGLFGKAAAGNPAAAYEYGNMLQEGLGGEKNCKEAQRWLQRAAEAGMVDAMTALGEAMLHSCNGEKNPTGAARWLKAAAEQSNVSAQFSLGILYFNGDGVPKNPVEAKKWLGLAASKGHPSAKFYLDRLN
jgi:TPR repeat protein